VSCTIHANSSARVGRRFETGHAEREPLHRSSAPKVELLAPAGGPDALVAAVENGADAVYLGLADLNARRGAANFDLESLASATRFAHLRGVSVYLTANVVILSHEMDAAIEMIDAAWSAGVDAVIVQDLGLLRLVRALLPEVRIHASTQINAMNGASVRALASVGASRVTLARELPLEAIRACAATGVEVETFVHGALCYCYSGQCLMSSLIGRRSANRGLCAQPCRMPYTLVGPRGEQVDAPGRYLLSTRDLAGIAHLPELVSAGVRALKIEGRMKAPEYVAIVTGVYRTALDRAIGDPERFEVMAAEWELLEEAFSRGFTDSYLVNTRGEELMSYTRPNNRGVLVGRVVGIGAGRARVVLERALDPRDTVEFWTRSGRFAQPAGSMAIGVREVTLGPAGATVELRCEQSVAPGDRVFRVANATLLAAARRTFAGAVDEERRATPVAFTVRVRKGTALALSAEAAGVRVEVEGPEVEPARTKAITPEEIVEHVGRLGGSGYRAAGWQIDLDVDAGVGFSTLHALRREALEQLDAARLDAWQDRRTRKPRIPAMPKRSASRGVPALVAVAWDWATAQACKDAGADEVLLRVFGRPDGPLPEGVRPLLPRVAWDDDVEALEAWLDSGPVTVGNLGLLAQAALRGPVIADWPLNVVNEHAAAALGDMGATFLWASPELSERQLALLAGGSPVPVGCVVWGRIELMVSEQCVLQASGPCARRCESCARRDGWWRLRDQKGYEFPVTTDLVGRSHIMNAVTLDLTRALDEVLATGVEAVRADFSDEDPPRAAEVVRAIRSALQAAVEGAPLPEGIVKPATSGHFFRGVR